MNRPKDKAYSIFKMHHDALRNIDYVYSKEEYEELRIMAISSAIVSCNLIREEYLLAPQIVYWNNIIIELKSYLLNPNEQV